MTAVQDSIDTYDYSGPPVDFVAAAQAGDLTAIQAAADWYRDRGQPAHPTNKAILSDEQNAYFVEVYKTEIELQVTKAKSLLTLLSMLQATFSEGENVSRRRVSRAAVDDALRLTYGLPVRVGRMDREGGCVICPTDYVNEDAIRSLLLATLARKFPRAKFDICFSNETHSFAGLKGENAFALETYTDTE
ncbi:hypothetical protein [Frigoriglobus tundricola]|uniref:Uncharacterized protein n=1 Tax=Frigoriglobus tundricola TaxID=2774151 RepID=A0A6M5YI64_9BACT|nr:hypothetical protein [Frigoriglobus tundricola]QJW92956.1 hypothetical protein FTUN_0454 [Frigoriglobus tundricola]